MVEIEPKVSEKIAFESREESILIALLALPIFQYSTACSKLDNFEIDLPRVNGKLFIETLIVELMKNNKFCLSGKITTGTKV